MGHGLLPSFLNFGRRPEGSPLDLNNLPEEYGKQAVDESSTTTAASTENSSKGLKKKKKEGKDESGKIYECRFCSLKFCKSQALGGHMNRHRQERETETLNRARQIVFNSDNLTVAGAHMGLRDLNFGGSPPAAMPSGCFQQVGGIGDPRLHFRPAVYPRAPTPPQPHHLQPYMFSSSTTSSHPLPYTAHYSQQPPPQPPPVNDYYIGRVLAGSSQNPPQNPNYTCFGAPPPAAGAFPPEGGVDRTPPGREGSEGDQDGENWGYSHRYVQSTDPSSVERFRDDI